MGSKPSHALLNLTAAQSDISGDQLVSTGSGLRNYRLFMLFCWETLVISADQNVNIPVIKRIVWNQMCPASRTTEQSF